jgi:hypothetical protein
VIEDNPMLNDAFTPHVKLIPSFKVYDCRNNYAENYENSDIMENYENFDSLKSNYLAAGFSCLHYQLMQVVH